jgi:TP901 family phage tail tape measure protein
MPEALNQAATISVGGDFTPFERQAVDAFKRTQGIFSKNFLGGSSFSRPLGEISARADEFTKSMTAANARVVAFGASAGVIYAVSKAMREMVSSTISVNKALTEVNVFLKLSNDGLEGFAGRLFDIAKGTGKSFEDIAKGATELARQGLGAEETLTRIKDAAILARQSGDDMTGSIEALTAAINSFAKTGLTTTQLINKLANVDAQFSVSSKDLAEGIKRVGSTADTAGISIDQLIGLITSVQQTTQRGGPVIGNALKSILTRVERPEILVQLREVGIQIDNVAEGSNKSISVLTQLAKTFDTLTDSQQSQVAGLVGSVYQINVLKALLADLNKNYSVYGQAVKTSSSAQDEAIKRNDEYNKSLDAILNKTKVTLTQVGSQVGDLTVAPALKKITGALDFLLGDVSKEGSSLGGELGKGVLKGIGNFISGPGIVLLGATIGKLAKDFSGFFLKASKDFFGLNEAAKQQGDLRTKLQAILSHEPQLLDAILTKNLSQVDAEKVLLNLLKERLAIEERLSQVSTKVATNALAKGTVLYDAEKNLKSGVKAASGLIPSIFPERSEFSELIGAIRGGYQPGAIRRMNVKGLGSIVYNSAEKVKNFGFDQPAILPPEQSKAGLSYKQAFKKVHGFDPYSTPANTAADGLLPDKKAKPNYPVNLMLEQLGPKRALKKSDAEALHVQKIKDRAVDDSKVLKLSSVSDISRIYSSFPDAQDKISELGDALKNGDKAEQRKIIRDAAQDVRRGLLKQGLEGIEIPIKIGNTTRKLFIESKKTAAGGLIPFRKIGQGNFADVFDIGNGLVAKKYAPARQVVERLGDQMAFETFKNGITGLKYLSELAAKNPASGIKVAAPIPRSEIDPEILEKVSRALGGKVFFQQLIGGEAATPEFAESIQKKANSLIKKNPYGISALRDITSRNIKGGTVIDLATNYAGGLDPVSKVFGLGKATQQFKRNDLPYAVSPADFLDDLLGSESIIKTQQHFSNKYGLSKPQLILENSLDAVLGKQGSGHRGIYSGSETTAADAPGRIHLSLSELISDISDGVGGRITNPDYLKVLRAGSKARGEHVFLHELYHNLSDKRGITNLIPTSVFGRTKDVLGGNHLNQALEITPKEEDFQYQFQDARVNGNHEESAAETLANLILYPERKVKGAYGKVQIGDLPLSRYFKEQGIVPNFGRNALQSAIEREKEAGAPGSSIKIGIDPRLKCSQNPLGLAVYNTKDEPSGLAQGINRAVKEGKDPHSYNVPNFASSEKPYESTKLPTAVTDRLVREELQDLKSALQNGTKAFNDIAAQVETLRKVFALTGDSANRAKQVLETAYNTRPGDLKSAGQAGIARANQTFAASNEIRLPFEFPDVPFGAQRSGKLQTGVPSNESYNIAPAFGLPQRNPPQEFPIEKAFQPRLSVSRAIEVGSTDDAKAYQDNLRQTELQARLVSNAKSVAERKERERVSAEQASDAKAFQQRLKDFDDLKRQEELRIKLAANAKAVTARLEAQQAENQLQIQREIQAYQSLGKFIPFSQTRQLAKDFEARQQTNLNDQVRQGGITPEQAAFAAQQTKKDANQNIAQKYSNASLAVSFTAPVLAGVVSQLAGDRTPTQRGIGASVEGLGNVASFASLGLGFGPHGALAGAGIGLLTSLPGILDAFTDKLPDLQREFEKLTESSNKTSDALNVYINASEKLGDVYTGLVTATHSTVQRLQSQQSEAFSKLTPEQQIRVNRSLQTGGIQGLTEEKALIEQESKQAELRKAAEIKLEEIRKGLGLFGFGNKFTEEDRTKIVGSKRISTGGGAAEAPVGSVVVPIFGQKLSKEGLTQAEVLKNLLLSLRGDKDKTIVDVLKQNLGDSTEKFNKVQEAVQKGDIGAFTSFLSQTLQKTGLTPEQAGTFSSGFSRIGNGEKGEETQKLFIEQFLKSINPEALKQQLAGEEIYRVVSQKLQKVTDEFAIRLSDAGINLAVFNKSLEGASKLVSQASTAREELSRARGTSFIDLQENFTGPSTIQSLRNQATVQSIQGERRLGVQSAGFDFQNQISQVLSQAIERFTGSELERSQAVKEIAGRRDILEGSLRTLKGLGINDITNVVNPGNPQETQQNITSILDKITQQRGNILRSGEVHETLTESERAQKNLLDELEKPLREALIDFSNNLEAANQKERESLRLQDVLNKAALDQIAIQKKLQVGGGIQNILAPGGQFQNQLAEGAFGIRAGARGGDNLLAGQGAFQVANVIQSLGATVPDSLRELVKKGIIDQLQEAFDAANVTVQKGSLENVANTQVESFFKREDKQGDLQKKLADVLGSQATTLTGINEVLGRINSDNVSIRELVDLGKNAGLLVKFKESLSPQNFGNVKGLLDTAFAKEFPSIGATFKNTGSPFGPATFNSDDLVPATGPKPIEPRSTYDSIIKRNLFSLEPNRDVRVKQIESQQAAQLDVDKVPQSAIDLSNLEQALSRPKNISATSTFFKDILSRPNLPLSPLGAPRAVDDFEATAGDLNVGAGINPRLRGVTRAKGLEALFQNDKSQTPEQIFNVLANNTRRREQESFGAQSIRLNAVDLAKKSADLTSDENTLRQLGLKLDTQRLDLEKRLKDNKIDSIQAERELNAQSEAGLATLKQTLFEQGKITGDELRDQKTRAYLSRIDAGTNKLTDPLEAFRDQFRYNRNDYFRDITLGAQDAGKAMKTSFSDAFKSFMDGSRTAGGALKDFGLGVANKIETIVSQISTNLLFKGVGSLLDTIAPNAFNALGSSLSGKSSGGLIKGYAVGGIVAGGSGIKDDVAAYLSNGEYVIKKQSVQKYGKEFLDSLNAQNFDSQPSFGTGAGTNSNDPSANFKSSFSAGNNSASVLLKNAFAYNNATNPSGGGFNTDSQLSNAALSDENNPQNQLKFKRQEDLFNYLQERAVYEANKEATLKNFSRAQRQRLIGAYINAAIQVGGSYLGSAFKPSESSVANTPSGQNSPNSRIRAGSYGPASTGGYLMNNRVQGFAAGGSPKGRDTVPVLLTGGEYVLNKQAVQRNGVGMVSQVNRGTFKGYAEGGLVGGTTNQASNYTDSFKDILTALNSITVSLKSNTNTTAPQNQPAGNDIFNVSVTVNVNKDGTTKSDNSKDKDSSKTDDANNSKKLAEMVKNVVVKTIIEQKKPNGLLAS